jgi:hypothetical protein
MSFVAGGESPDFTVTNDGWWPDIDAAAIREALRLDGTVTDARLEVATVNAMLSVNRELALLKAQHQVSGAARLEDVAAPLINEESALVVQYRRAVFCTAGAELVERYRSYDTTSSGHQAADLLNPSIDELRRDARWAIRDLLGVGRTTVVLI